MKKNFIILTLLIFVLLSAVFFAMQTYAPEFKFAALEGANVVMAFLSLSSYLMVQRQMDNTNTQAFIRGVSGASFLKLMVCMIAILVYVLLNREHIHKPTVFVMLGVYAIYTVTETILLSQLVRNKN